MIELYYWPTPNGHKITMFLEEAGLDYCIVPVDISAGGQFARSFLRISPNNRIPAIVDRQPGDGGEPMPVFESGAILLYLAEKTGQLLPRLWRNRKVALEWLFWQVGGLGPMAGQSLHFRKYASQRVPYAIERYARETQRLHGVVDSRLSSREFLAGEYSIADIATYPWITVDCGQDLAPFPNLQRWVKSIRSRAATVRAYERAQLRDDTNCNCAALARFELVE